MTKVRFPDVFETLGRSDANDAPHVFQTSLVDVLRAILDSTEIDSVDIAKKILDPDFRFTTTDQPELSLLLSHALARTVVAVKAAQPKPLIRPAMRKKRQKTQDEALHILRSTPDIAGMSVMQIAQLLSQNNVKLPRGKNWTYQSTVRLLDALREEKNFDITGLEVRADALKNLESKLMITLVELIHDAKVESIGNIAKLFNEKKVTNLYGGKWDSFKVTQLIEELKTIGFKYEAVTNNLKHQNTVDRANRSFQIIESQNAEYFPPDEAVALLNKLDTERSAKNPWTVKSYNEIKRTWSDLELTSPPPFTMKKSESFARYMYSIVQNIKKQNESFNQKQIIMELNNYRIPTQRNGTWKHSIYRKLLDKFDDLHLNKKDSAPLLPAPEDNITKGTTSKKYFRKTWSYIARVQQDKNVVTPAQIAGALNRQGYLTKENNEWNSAKIKHAIKRGQTLGLDKENIPPYLTSEEKEKDFAKNILSVVKKFNPNPLTALNDDLVDIFKTNNMTGRYGEQMQAPNIQFLKSRWKKYKLE